MAAPLHRSCHMHRSIKWIRSSLYMVDSSPKNANACSVHSITRQCSQMIATVHRNSGNDPVNRVLRQWAIIRECRHYHAHGRKKRVLGIETSCDDTGAAVVDEDGIVLGEALNSQTQFHVQHGGINPNTAKVLHKEHIEDVVNSALKRAGVTVEDVDAVATTVKPGLAPCLGVGLEYTKEILRKHSKPFIPIHHMEAHALTARMLHDIEFPFLVLLVSGGHCLLSVVKNVDDFLLIGKSADKAPGDAFDKIACRLCLKDLPQCQGMSGGRSLEVVAQRGDPHAFPLHHVMSHRRDCEFSFSGIQSTFMRIIEKEEAAHEGRGSLPCLADICASFQYNVLHHLAKRLQRGFLFCEMKGLIPENANKTLVISGGVASNTFLRKGLERVCDAYDAQLICPPPNLCTDNGVMIAWNGMEKLRLGIGFADDPQSYRYTDRCPLGVDITNEVASTSLRLPKIELLDT